MLKKGGWKVDYRHRKQRDYKDPMYIYVILIEIFVASLSSHLFQIYFG